MVSVIMPCYNAGKYIREAIESIVNQTYQDWELIIINDGSTDNSRQVVEDYIKSHITNSESDKSRIRLVSQPNSGACRARNNGIEHANGEYIKFLDADDILMPTCLEEQMQQIAQLKDNQIPFGYYGNVDEQGTLLPNYQFSSSEIANVELDPIHFFFHNWHILITCPLHRKEILQRVGGFDEGLKRGQEFDLHFRLALEGVEFRYFPTYTFVYRDYESQYRISCNGKLGTQDRTRTDFARYVKFETLLQAHYGHNMPMPFVARFTREWFSKARELFAQHNTEEGKIWLTKVIEYGCMNQFQKAYCWLGRIVGYTHLEQIFQLRLKLLSKK